MCRILLVAIFSFILVVNAWDDHTNRVPTRCETCKLLTQELTEALKKLDSNQELETRYKLDEDMIKKKSKKYQDSELRLIEAMGASCKALLDYNVQTSKKKGTARYTRDPHPTIKALKDIRSKGADVDIGIPHDMWDTPSIEIMRLKRSCDTMLELYEEDIEDWFFHHRPKMSLEKYLCEGIVLKDESKRCLKDKKLVYKKDEF